MTLLRTIHHAAIICSDYSVSKAFNLDSTVGRGGVGCDEVRWQGAPTQWALAHQEKQRGQRAAARRNRLRSALIQMVMMRGQSRLNRHASSEAVGSGQLPNLGLM
jgi:hypothetical protein